VEYRKHVCNANKFTRTGYKYYLMIDLSRKSIVSKFLDGLLLNILLRLKGVVYIPILVTFFSKSDIGLLTLWQSIASLLMGIYLLNMPDSANRVILNYDKNNEKKLVTETISSIFTVSFIVFFIVTVLVLLAYYVFPIKQESDYFIEVLLLLVLSNILSKLSIFTFQIFQKTKLIVKTQLLIEYSSLGVVTAGVFLLEVQDIKFVIFTYVLISLVVSFYLFRLLYREYRFRIEINSKILKKILKVSIFLLPNAYALVIIQNSDYLMIKYFLSLVEVGEYSFAFSLSSVVSGLSMAITFFWYSTAVYANEDQITKMLNTINMYMPMLLLVLIFVYYLSTKEIISLINSDYLSVFHVVQVLIIGLYCNIYIQVLSGALYARHKESTILFSVLFGAITNLVLNYYLIQKYGLLGGALATTLAYIFILLIQYNSIRKVLIKIDTWKNNLMMTAVMFISLLFVTFNFLKGILWI
jgi:O-antigen/teichoic acid export membrane protein